MERQLLVYPLYYKFSEGDIPENIRRCEEISRQCGAGCVFRIVERTNYYLSSILTDNGYRLEKCGVVGECSLTGDAGKMCVKESVQGGLFLKNGNGGTEYVMAGEMAVGIKHQGLLFLPDDYSCAMKSRFRKSGNQITGRRKSSLASLLA